MISPSPKIKPWRNCSHRSISTIHSTLQSSCKCYLVACLVFILLSRESDQSATTNSLRSSRPSVCHFKTGKSREVSFLTTQANLPTCSPHRTFMPSVKQASCEYQFNSHWFEHSRKRTRIYCFRSRRSTNSTN